MCLFIQIRCVTSSMRLAQKNRTDTDTIDAGRSLPSLCSASQLVDRIRSVGGDAIFFSHGSSHSAGVMILFNRLPGNIIDHRSDTNGHWLMVVTDINGTNYILVCIYGYNRKIQNNNFLSILCKQIDEWKVLYTTDTIIIGGDFYLVSDEWLDRLPLRGHCHKFNEPIIHLTSKLNLTDCWRLNGQCSRLDYWLISNFLANKVSKCEISASPLTDHCVISLSFSLCNFNPNLTPIWKFNNNLLENTDFCRKIKKLIKETLALDMSSLIRWVWFKFSVKQVAINSSQYCSRLKKQKQQELISEMNRLCCKAELSLDDHIKLNSIQTQLDNMYMEKAKGAFIRSRARWIEQGKKNSYFFNLEKQTNEKENSETAN